VIKTLSSTKNKLLKNFLQEQICGSSINEVELTKATTQDFENVHQILMHKDVIPYMNYPVLSQEDFKEIWQDIFSRLWIWKNNEEILGLVVIKKGTHRIKHVCYIEKLAINQSLDTKGLGTIFFEKIISSLKLQGFTKIELSVEVDNLRAISFYQKFGFEIEGTSKNLLNREGKFIDNYYMAKTLGDKI
jgi:putative acetyltransferase